MDFLRIMKDPSVACAKVNLDSPVNRSWKIRPCVLLSVVCVNRTYQSFKGVVKAPGHGDDPNAAMLIAVP